MLLLHTWAFAGVLLGPVELEWRAPAGCSSGAAVVLEVERLLAGRAPERVVAVRAEVTADRAGVAGAVVIDGAAPRTLRAGGCDALAHAVAVVIAVAVDPGLAGALAGAPEGVVGSDPNGVGEAGGAVVPPPPVADAVPTEQAAVGPGSGSGAQAVVGPGSGSGAQGPGSGSGAQAVVGPGSGSGAQAAVGPGAGSGEQAPGSGSGAQAVVGLGSGYGAQAGVPVVPGSGAQAGVSVRERPAVWHAIGVRGGALIGLSDFPTAGVGLTYSLERGLLRVEARAMYATPRGITYDDVRGGPGVRVQALTFGALGCVSPGNATARVPMCLGAELGPMIGRGIGVPDGQTRASLWATGLLTVAAVGRVSRRFNIIVAAELGVALRRPGFHVGEREVLVRSRAFGARILLGFEIVFGR